MAQFNIELKILLFINIHNDDIPSVLPHPYYKLKGFEKKTLCWGKLTMFSPPLKIKTVNRDTENHSI